MSEIKEPQSIPMLAASMGVSFRQLDYWVRRGYLRSISERSGSGYSRHLPDHEIRVAEYMIRLINAGVSVDTSALAARRFVDEGTLTTKLSDGVTVVLEDWDAPSSTEDL